MLGRNVWGRKAVEELCVMAFKHFFLGFSFFFVFFCMFSFFFFSFSPSPVAFARSANQNSFQRILPQNTLLPKSQVAPCGLLG